MNIAQAALICVIAFTIIGLLNISYREQPSAMEGFCPDCDDVRTPNGEQCGQCRAGDFI
ncbi:hypothetical protein [Sphingomonas sp. R1]|uniref:hypothetical protein n=1 Tax=Sphingomonas sp. R1 TaxID=399176 RepID=UPI00222505B6|nr:hypothetical protein [Sphingomonas sp. R1]UYY77812.1 hypothetical protein OIM94_02040 [Sphingomonas sp. R1]